MNYSRVIQFQGNTYLTPPPLSNPILPSRRTRRINYSRVDSFLSPFPSTWPLIRRKNAYAYARTATMLLFLDAFPRHPVFIFRRYRYYSPIIYTRAHIYTLTWILHRLYRGDRNGWLFEASKNKETRQIVCRPVAINHLSDTCEIFLLIPFNFNLYIKGFFLNG